MAFDKDENIYVVDSFNQRIQKFTKNGDFIVVEGESAENPLLPKVPDDCMMIASMFIPAYTFKPQNVTIRKLKHQRYTMKDIGKLAKRIDHVEYSHTTKLSDVVIKSLLADFN